QPREYLDEETAATVTVVAEPLVFALPRPELAANVRDYVTLAAAAVDRNGKVSYVLIAYFWSTVDPRLRTDALPSPEPLVLQADDRRIALALLGHSAHEAGIGVPVHAPPGAVVPPNVYGTDLGTLRFIEEARSLTLTADSDGTPLSYQLWEDHRVGGPNFALFLIHPGCDISTPREIQTTTGVLRAHSSLSRLRSRAAGFHDHGPTADRFRRTEFRASDRDALLAVPHAVIRAGAHALRPPVQAERLYLRRG